MSIELATQLNPDGTLSAQIIRGGVAVASGTGYADGEEMWAAARAWVAAEEAEQKAKADEFERANKSGIDPIPG